MQEIPFVDIRETGPIVLLQQYADRAIHLVNASRNTFGAWSRAASFIGLPLADHVARKWLQKSHNLYYAEISQYDKMLGINGVFALNLCYEWGCTSGVYRHDGDILLARVLDWPFPALGENIVVAYQRGQTNDFYNITWPGVSGVFQAVMPNRFAASLNQAPMRRYKTNLLTDWVRNRAAMYKQKGLPPAHLLRKAFETCNSYTEAKRLLATEPVSIPVIYTLCGIGIEEGCVIERLEQNTAIRELGSTARVCATNHFESYLNGIGQGWKPRSLDSDYRYRQACSIAPDISDATLGWFLPPIANALSRLTMLACPNRGSFIVIGTDGIRPVTKPFVLPK